jgi:phage tail-like protein
MMSASLLPPVPQPPHDPTSWLLDGRIGWRESTLDNISVLRPNRALALSLAPGSSRSLTEDSGSFGGLTTPANVAVGPDGSLYLLDAAQVELKRFDACDCRFYTVPCFAGPGSGPRQMRSPHGIAISSGNLFVCDTGNNRLSVFGLPGLVLRAHWRPPASAYEGPNPQLKSLWQPYDLAFDGRGNAYVSDPANGCVHRISPSGNWQGSISHLGAVTWIATDCLDRIYVVTDDLPRSVKVISKTGAVAAVASTADELREFFPSAVVETDASGLMHLSRLCAPKTPGCKEAAFGPNCPPNQKPEPGVFDLQGQAVDCLTPLTPSYAAKGYYYSTALDSALYRCQWHRVILRGEIPAGARVMVSTYTAEALLTEDQVQSLTSEWDTNQIASETAGGQWDCLVRSGGARFLWLKLEFRGNSKLTPRIDSIEIEFPRISLRRYLPAVFGEEPVSADLTDRFLALFDTTLRSIESKLDTQAHYYDPLSAPSERDPKSGADFLSWLASWIGLTLDRHWPEQKRRRFLKAAGRLFDLRGTPEGLRRELLLFLDMEKNDGCASDQPRGRCETPPLNCAPPKKPDGAWLPPPLILEHFKLRRWLFLGAGRVGDQAELWGKRIVNRSQLDDGAQIGHTQLVTSQDPLRDPFHVYAHRFTVFVPACYGATELQRRSLENLLKNGRPAATQSYIEYVEPRFRIGFQSAIGLDSVIARYPQGVTLNHTPLNRGSVLTTHDHEQGGPSLEIGSQSRIGSTTKLE